MCKGVKKFASIFYKKFASVFYKKFASVFYKTDNNSDFSFFPINLWIHHKLIEFLFLLFFLRKFLRLSLTTRSDKPPQKTLFVLPL